MPMTAGSVTVADNEVATGSGLALARYQADVATRVLPTLPVLGSTAAPYRPERPVQQSDIDSVKAVRLATLREAARLATAYATADVTYFTANMKARVTSESLGTVPDPADPGTPIAAPGAPVDIPIV